MQEPDRSNRDELTKYPPQVPVPELKEAALLGVLETINNGFDELYGGGDRAEEAKAHLTFTDYMTIYAMLPNYRDVVIAIEEYMFARTEF